MAEVVDVDLELIQEGTDFLLLEEVPDREPMQSRQSKIQSPVGDTTATTVAAVTTTSAESTPPVRPKTNIYSLAAETVISILEFLRATDLCAVSETDKTVFSSTRIKLAISYQLNFLYPLLERQNSGGGGSSSSSNGGTPIKSTGSSGSLASACSTTPSSSYSPTTAHGSYLHSYFLEQQIQQQNPNPGTSPSTTTTLSGMSSGTRAASPSPKHPVDEAAHAALSPMYHTNPQHHRFSMLGMGIDLLYVREIKSIIAALSSPQPVSGKMYWISTSWVANAKKYYEALALPEININTTEGRRCAKAGQNKRIAKIRVRRGSDALPPWPQMNSELVCSHGRLSLAKTPKGKRRLISASAWHLLRKFYPSGPAFPAGPAPKGTPECALCSRETDEAKQVQVEQREKELSRRAELLPAELLSLFSRKSGVPTELLVRRRATFVENADRAPAVAGPGTDAGRSEGIAIPPSSPSLLLSSSSSPPPPSPPPPRQASPVPYGRPPLARSGSFSLSPFSESGAGGGQRPSLSARSSLASLDSLDDDEGYEDEELFEYYDLGAATGGASLRQQRQQQQQQNFHHPLVPGIYHLVPRSWVRKWRHYNKDPSSSSTSVPPIDCTSLLCHSHGLCVVPPHLEEYLLCVRKTLLGGLGQYPGEVVEVISLEEWEALHSQLKSFPDLSVSFSLSPEGDVAWNVGICQACDPYNYGHTISSPQRRRA